MSYPVHPETRALPLLTHMLPSGARVMEAGRHRVSSACRGYYSIVVAVKLIVNADDFGASTEVNAAVADARRGGVLTSASLMMTGLAVAEAVEMAQRDDGLAVGLHLSLSNGRSLLPRAAIPALVDASGRFPESPVMAGLRYYFIARARRQLRMEIEAQFEAFARTGLRLSHVDGHQHLHVHPSVLQIAVELAVAYGASGFRIPCDPLWCNMQVDRSRLATKAVVALGHACLAAGARRSVRTSGLSVCDMAIGSLMSGRMNADYVIRLLKRVVDRTVEVFFHPSVCEHSEPLGPNRGDLEALTDDRLRQFIANNGYQLCTYPELRGRSGCG